MRNNQNDESCLPDKRNLREHVSERVSALNLQIREIADSSARYREQAVRTKLDRSAHQMRELRLPR